MYEGVLSLKIRYEVILDDWVSAIIVPEINCQQVEPAVPKELRSRGHFLQNDCRDIWEWSEKAYEYHIYAALDFLLFSRKTGNREMEDHLKHMTIGMLD